MTTRKPGKTLLAAALAVMVSLLPHADAAQRAKTYADAREMAGDDGIVVYCYGPDWNKRSVRMLKTFWEDSATEEAAGDAILVAAPFFQVREGPEWEENRHISQGLKEPPFCVCPALQMIDKSGNVYCVMTGMDYFGDENGELARKNIREKLAELRKQKELLAQAEGASGLEKAKLLGAVADLSIKTPEGLVDEIEQADPEDKTGLVRRNRHSARGFMYKQLETSDGFLKKDFVPDVKAITSECMKIVEDEAYRPRDRQEAYNLIIGLSRAAGMSPTQLRALFKKSKRIDENSIYGQVYDELAERWLGSGKSSGGGAKTAAERAAERAAKREARLQEQKARREARKQKRRSGRDDDAEEEEE